MSKMRSPIRNGIAKVPTIMQLEAMECGAASLSMILAYYGKWISLEQVNRDCGVSRDGSNAYNIIVAAMNYGLDADGMQSDIEWLQKEATYPCILHWNFTHFVVLDGFRGDKAIINDPARGRVAVSMEEFSKSFTGISIQLQPTEEFEPSGSRESVFEFARRRLAGQKEIIAFMIAIIGITTIFGILQPMFSRMLIDKLLIDNVPDWAYSFLLVFAIFILLRLFISWLQTFYIYRIQSRLARVGRSSFVWKILHLPMDFFSQRTAGDLVLREQENATIAQTFVNTMAPLLLNFVAMVFYLIVMIRYSWILALIGLASVVINLLMLTLVSRRRVDYERVQYRDRARTNSTLASAIRMIETIKSSGAEQGYFSKWAGYKASESQQTVNLSKLTYIVGLVPSIISQMLDNLILLIGVYLVMNGQFTVGMVMAFQGFLSCFQQPAMEMANSSQQLIEMRTSMERVNDVMDYPEDLFSYGEVENESHHLRGDITLSNVTFGYSPLADPLIEDLNLNIKAGSSTAIVGLSGCGKSTISKLITGLYSPWSGEILYDGLDRDSIGRGTIVSSIAAVDQEIILFDDTIKNNLTMWDEHIDEMAVINAAKDAQIHNRIMDSDNGYDHRIVSEGREFSGGERQRLEVARALCKNPSIIILDEATSALDAKTEKEMMDAIRDRDVTSIIIAHRLSTIRSCDNIIVLDQGTIVEQGTHEQLIAKDGFYKRLVSEE